MDWSFTKSHSFKMALVWLRGQYCATHMHVRAHARMHAHVCVCALCVCAHTTHTRDPISSIISWTIESKQATVTSSLWLRPLCSGKTFLLLSSLTLTQKPHLNGITQHWSFCCVFSFLYCWWVFVLLLSKKANKWLQFKSFKWTSTKLTGGTKVTLVNVSMSNSGDGPDVNDLNRTVHFCCSGLKMQRLILNSRKWVSILSA